MPATGIIARPRPAPQQLPLQDDRRHHRDGVSPGSPMTSLI